MPDTAKGRAGKDPKKATAGSRPKRMRGFDFATWRAGTEDPAMRSTIVGLLILGESPDWDSLVSRFDRASRTTPALRQKVVDEGGLSTPRMIYDDEFDLSFHVVRFRMPEGATWDDVLDDARRESMTDFDHDRPLWRVTLLEDLPDGEAALILKVHHAMMDGEGIVMLGAALFDFTPEGQDLGPMPEAPQGRRLSRREFAKTAVQDEVRWTAKSVEEFIEGFGPETRKALRDPGKTVAGIVDAAASAARFLEVPLGPLSPVMTKRGLEYHFSTFEMPFDQIHAAGKDAGHTVNDVFMAAVAEGMRIYHQELGSSVPALRVNMPVSTRKAGDSIQNAVNVARFELPMGTSDSRSLMDQIAAAVKKVREDPAINLANQFGELSRFVPPEIISAAAMASDVTTSNVPGIPVPVWIAGAPVRRMYPLVPTVGAAANITLLTYDGTATFGVSTDDAAVPDRGALLGALRRGFSQTCDVPVPERNPIDGEVAAAEAPARPQAAARVRVTKSSRR